LKKKIERELISFFKKKNRNINISFKTNLLLNGLLDSTTFVELILFIEKNFSLKLKKRINKLVDFSTIQKIYFILKNEKKKY
jgi:acyl carrier protein